jgi:cob(I)alamin adenosyltransferase
VKIYTKTGDEGQTSLYSGVRVYKNDLRCEVYGAVDELNSQIGVLLSFISSTDKKLKATRQALSRVQNELFDLGAELATPKKCAGKNQSISAIEISQLEHEIDLMEKKMKPICNFILPGGSKVSAGLHLARTLCRRAERNLITLHQNEGQRHEVLMYLNRLSDYLFVVARYVNHLLKVKDVFWKQK